MTFYKLIVWCWIIVAVFWMISAFSTKRTIKRQSAPSRWKYSFFFGGALWLLFRYVHSESRHPWGVVVLPQSAVLGAVGLVLAVLGLCLAIWARVVLGANWSGVVTFKENHELITRGPYALARHPIYTALLLMYLGTELAIGTFGGLVGLPMFFLSFWIKLRQEEALMTEHFGEQYVDYMKRVRAIIPFVL